MPQQTSAARRRPSEPGVEEHPEPRAPADPRAHRLLALQRTAGNASVARALTGARPRRVSVAQAGAQLQHELESRPARQRGDGVQFRLPTAADVTAELNSGRVGHDDLKAGIATALTRMARENRLTTKDPVPAIIERVFPQPGVFDEGEYAKVADLGDRDKVYANIADARTTVSSTDQPALIGAMRDAITLINNAAANTAGLKQVFGAQSEFAMNVYTLAAFAVQTLIESIADPAKVNTDYNRDDEQTGVAGSAVFKTGKVHFTRKIASVVDVNETKATIVHESTHLAEDSVKDKGYYNSPGFLTLSDLTKATNAAHYEELPRRALGISKYDGMDFIEVKRGQTANPEIALKREVSEYFRKAWDSAAKVHNTLRVIRTQILRGDRSGFDTHKKRILEISELMKLTVHKQVEGQQEISAVDTVLTEGVAHALNTWKSLSVTEPDLEKVQGKDDPGRELIVNRIIRIGPVRPLTGDVVADALLCDWLEAAEPFKL